MIPPMNHSNYRLPVLPANGRAGSRLKSFVMTCSLIFAAAGFCLAATNCSNGNKTSDTPPALSFETASKTLEVGETYPARRCASATTAMRTTPHTTWTATRWA